MPIDSLVCGEESYMDLSAQHGGQQGHPDVHAILCLAEIRCSRVRVHLRTERETGRQERSQEISGDTSDGSRSIP